MYIRELIAHPSVPGIFWLIALVVCAWAFGDAVARRSAAWLYAGQKRGMWLALTGAAFFLTVLGVGPVGLLGAAAVVVAVVYLADVRPKLRTYHPPRSSRDIDVWRR